MKRRPIKPKKAYETALGWVDSMFDKKVKINTPAGEHLQVVLLLIKEYEDRHYPIPALDPFDAIKGKMHEQGLKNKDLVGTIGTKGYISPV